jgi:glycosyltransferase involved in cell wall biosynthesis
VPRSFKALERHLEAFRPDVVHVDEPERLTYGYWRRPGLGYARARGIPAVAFYHTNYVDYGPDFIPLPSFAVGLLQRLVIPALAWVYNAYDATLVPSATTADKLRKYGIHNIAAGRFNGVDFGRFSGGTRMPAFFERCFGGPPLGDRVKLLFVGRLTPDKGWAFALKALPALVAQSAPGRLAVLVAGAGVMRDEIEGALRDRLDVVHFLGPVQPEKMPDVYANSDIHVSCSQKENAPLTALEAGAAGVPVVAPRAGGFIDTVGGDGGGLYRPGDIEDFLRTIAPFVADAELRKACGARGRRSAEGLDWDRTAKQWLDAIVAVRARSGRKRAGSKSNRD